MSFSVDTTPQNGELPIVRIPTAATEAADKIAAKRIEDQGAEVETDTPEQLKTLVKSEVAHWKNVVIAAKIRVD